jgi:NAD+ kinase
MPGNQPSATDSPVRAVGITAKWHLREAASLLDDLAGWLSARGIQPVYETETARLATSGGADFRSASREELPNHVDLVLVLGGDGTLLSMADRIALAGRDIPILGVNFGSLGFLTEITLPELYPALETAIAGTAQVEERLMLRCAVLRREQAVSTFVVLNDVVITRGTVSRIIDLAVWVDDQFVARFKADGIILASPTGSTAYNLAAGGPIVHPTVDAMVLTPIAPHTLSNRPVVIPGTARVRIEATRDDARQEIYATFDGQQGCPLEPGDVVTVQRCVRPLRLVRAATRNYFEVLRRKLKWAER